MAKRSTTSTTIHRLEGEALINPSLTNDPAADLVPRLKEAVVAANRAEAEANTAYQAIGSLLLEARIRFGFGSNKARPEMWDNPADCAEFWAWAMRHTGRAQATLRNYISRASDPSNNRKHQDYRAVLRRTLHYFGSRAKWVLAPPTNWATNHPEKREDRVAFVVECLLALDDDEYDDTMARLYAATE